MRKTGLARALRRRMPDAEVRLWVRLRRRQLMGHHFCRQIPVGPYVVDFMCRSARLAIEVDGAQHRDQQAYDAARTRFLERQGYVVLRFANHDVFTNIHGVMETIAAHLQGPVRDG